MAVDAVGLAGLGRYQSLPSQKVLLSRLLNQMRRFPTPPMDTSGPTRTFWVLIMALVTHIHLPNDGPIVDQI